MATDRITVIGAGVIGLTTAVTLAERGHEVNVLARDLPLETTSAMAGALWYPYRAAPADRVLPWSKRSFAVYESAATDADSGVAMVDGLELRRSPSTPWFLDALPATAGFAHYQPLPDGYQDAWQMRLPVIKPARYLTLLVKRLYDAGGTVTRLAVTAMPEEAVVVNCTGLAARSLAHDPAVAPVAGQVVRLERPGGLDTWLLDHSDESAPIYVIPRATDVVVGGTANPGWYDNRPDAAVEVNVLHRAVQLVPQLEGARVIGRSRGLRPTRPAVRVEAERAANGGLVIHNYGHGGCGWTLAWGCAEEAAMLVAQYVPQTV